MADDDPRASCDAFDSVDELGRREILRQVAADALVEAASHGDVVELPSEHGDVADVRQGKFFEIELKVPTPAAAEKLAAEVADRVLANPVIESYRVEIE